MSDEPESDETAPAPAKAKKSATPKDKGKGKADAKDKKGKGKKGKKGKSGGGGLSVAGHPRAAGAVRRAKGFGGVAGFALAALLSHQAGLSITHTLERALLAGIAGYLIAWACAVTVWRQILIAQLRASLARHETAPPTRRTLPPPDAVTPAAPTATAEDPAAPAASAS